MKATAAALDTPAGSALVMVEWARARERRLGHTGYLTLLGNAVTVLAGGPYRLRAPGKPPVGITLAAELRPACTVPFALADAEGWAP
jgi:hypothetical protein